MPELTPEVLKILVTHIMGNINAGTYSKFLGELISQATLSVLENVGELQMLVDNIIELQLPCAKEVLRAVIPLIKLSSPLKNSLLMALRKGLYRPTLEAKQVGAVGFLLLLKHFQVIGSFNLNCSQSSFSQSSHFSSQSVFSLTQVQAEVHGETDPKHNRALCREMLGILQRAMLRSPGIREIIYQGLRGALSRNQRLCGPVLSLLCNQFHSLYIEGEAVPPFHLDLCLAMDKDEPVVLVGDHYILNGDSSSEPLGEMLSLMFHCLKWHGSEAQGEEESESSEDVEAVGDSECVKTRMLGSQFGLTQAPGAFQEVSEELKSLRERLISCELNDLHLDPNANYNSTTHVGLLNVMKARLVMNVCEALMEGMWLECGLNMTRDEANDLLKLHALRRRIDSTLKEAVAKPGKKKKKEEQEGKKVATKLLPYVPLMSLRSLAQMIQAILSDENPHHQEPLEVWKCNLGFLDFLLNSTLLHLKHFPSQEDIPFKLLCDFGRFLLKWCSDAMDDTDEVTQQQMAQGLEILSQIVHLIQATHRRKLCILFCALVETNAEGYEGHGEVLRILQKFLLQLLRDREEGKPKDAIPVVDIMNVILNDIPAEEKLFKKSCSWLERLCQEVKVDDSQVSKVVVSSLLRLLIRCIGSPSAFQTIAKRLHYLTGNLNDDAEAEKEDGFLMIKINDVPGMCSLFVGTLERVLSYVEWVLSQARATIDVQDVGETSSSTFQSLEQGMCGQLGMVYSCCVELVECSLPLSCCDSFFKLLSHFYKTHTAIARYYMEVFRKRKKDHQICPRFEKLVSCCCQKLTPLVYAFITYAEASLSCHLCSQSRSATQRESEMGKKRKPELAKARVLKETRSIPALVFALEQFEKCIMGLSKKSKVDMWKQLQLGVARDFRINGSKVQAALQQLEPLGTPSSISPEQMETDIGGDDNRDERAASPTIGGPAQKRRRRN
ncbi:unnamed protein product [Darwinula stevensoni]|uniref:Fanconi anemia group I protein n=1 Tax=Darwinula stevensoni TaxID=69355 RepID=A0A7R8XEM9_9CRUS|nr:unnamed protein product [Darwinula stevensoni]CAG0895465.1 unnamed protein product [Darwinula stevensoni]